MLGGYTWNAKVNAPAKTISVDVYLFVSASRKIELPGGETATITMKSEMPWQGKTEWEVNAPEGWKWELQIPTPSYASNVKVSVEGAAGSRTTLIILLGPQLSADHESAVEGYALVKAKNNDKVALSFDLSVSLVAPHIECRQDTLTVKRGPIVYVAESVDNAALEKKFKHFDNIGITQSIQFEEESVQIEGLETVTLVSEGQGVFQLKQSGSDLYRPIAGSQPAREWSPLDTKLTLVPWFARANRGGAGHVRTSFLRVPSGEKAAVNGVNGNHASNGNGVNGHQNGNGHA